MQIIHNHIQQIEVLCKSHFVHHLYAYGSVTTNDQWNNQSDIDLIVAFEKNVPIEMYAELYVDLVEKLESVFNRKVDLMTEKPLSNPFLRNSIESTKVKIYEA